MVSQADARDLARQIVESVLADHDARSAGVVPTPERPDTLAWQVAGRIVDEVLTAHAASGPSVQGPPPPPAPHERDVPAEAVAPGTPAIPDPDPEPEPEPVAGALAEPGLVPGPEPLFDAGPGPAPGPEPVFVAEPEPVLAADVVAVADPALGPGLEGDSWSEPVEPRPRTGRWLLTTILGAIALALLLPLAIGAVRDLVALS